MMSWRTTIAGIVMILAGVALMLIQPTAANSAIGVGLIGGGAGLLKARDAKVSDEESGAGNRPPGQATGANRP